jgi:DUF1680 family protein
MKNLSAILSLMIIVLLIDCQRPISDNLLPEFRSFDTQNVKVEGELGRRLDLISTINIPKIDIENIFLNHFRNQSPDPKVRDGFVGIGMLLDAILRFAYYSQDPAMMELKEYIAKELIEAQGTDGYIGIFTEEKRQTGWDTHEGGYIILALTNDYILFEEKGSLLAASKYADYLISRNVTQLVGLDEGFIQLYHATDDRKYLDYCINIFGLKDFYFSIQHHTRHVYGHMERALMQLKLFEVEPDENLLYKPRVAVEFLVNMDGLDIIGGSGVCEHFNTTHEGNVCNAESCATAYIIWLLHDLLKMEGNSFYGDIMERSIYNALFAAMSPTGDSIRYFTDYESAKEYYPDDYFCCPNNYRRIISDLPELIYYKSDKGIAVNLYSNSTVTALINNQRVVVRQQTEYPSSGDIKLFIDPAEESTFEVKLRIPLWCKNPTVKINDSIPFEKPITGTFYIISRRWDTGDIIELSLPMEYRLVRGRGSQWRKVALLRGPVVYGISDKINPYINENTDIRIDADSFSNALFDDQYRPGGMKCTATLENDEQSGITFTEFIDPTGIKTFFFLSKDSDLVEEDEFVTKQY